MAALAGLIFLLGATLVVVTRLQTASSNYDQRVRLAREHARAAMDMAVAELQDKLGKDISVSFTADTLSSATTEDFKVDRTGAVREPFWTGASDGGSTSWLVTKSLGGASVSPEGAFTGDQVELLGAGTVGNNDLLKVSVPTEAIKVDGVDGFAADSERTIGNYGYWIGDLGVKASYAWYDQVESVSHDAYETTQYDPNVGVTGDEWFDRKERLRQMMVAKPLMTEIGSDSSVIDMMDTNDVDPTPSNPERIDMFIDDFQFREHFGGSGDEERYLFGLSSEEVGEYFQDFTPLSKGLLVNSASGGYKHDLSKEGTGGLQDYIDYAILARSSVSQGDSYNRHVFSVRKPNYFAAELGILPAVVGFNLTFIVDVVDGVHPSLVISYQATAEIWNPYTSSIDLNGQEIALEIDGLPPLSVWLNGVKYLERDKPVSLDDSNKPIRFVVSSSGAGTSQLEPGQIVTLSGPSSDVGEWGDVSLSVNGEGLGWQTFKVFDIDSEALPITSLDIAFGPEDDPKGYQFNMPLRLRQEGETWPIQPNMIYSFDGCPDYELPLFSLLDPSDFPARFGFTWQVGDGLTSFDGEFAPSRTTISYDDLVGWSSVCSDSINTNANFSDSSTDLLGDNSGAPISDRVPFFSLPKQEATNVAHLAAGIPYWPNHDISLGDKASDAANQNSFFDAYYFSTIPLAIEDWNSESVLPNSFLKPISGVSVEELISDTEPERSLFLHGMFNVHSTSIDSWVSLLKGAPVDKHPYWKNVFAAGTYLFSNYPLGGEDSNQKFPVFEEGAEPAKMSLEAKQLSLQKNAFALTESQITTLAGLIVKEIRAYVGSSGKPFDSLKDFVNWGVIQNAIDAMDANEATRINPTWVVDGTPGKFRQSTVLNLISGILSVRSDTFLVRAYGDAVDPADPNKIWAKAYCEAIVQRVHEEYGDVADAPAGINRKFEIVAFRWLAPSEI